MADSERPMVNFLVDQEVKEEWEQHVKDSGEFSSLSQLIRTAVHREVEGQHEQGGGVPDGLAQEVAEIADRTSRLDDQMDRVVGTLDDLNQQVGETPGDVQDLASDVFEALPTEAELHGEQGSGMVGEDEAPAVVGDTVQTGQMADIADHLREPRYRVREAIEHLQQSTSMIRSTVIQGEQRYHRRR